MKNALIVSTLLIVAIGTYFYTTTDKSKTVVVPSITAESFINSEETKEFKEIVQDRLQAAVLINVFEDSAENNGRIYNLNISPRTEQRNYYHGVTSGTVVSEDGYVITTYDSVKGADRIIITLFPESKEMSAGEDMIIGNNDYDAEVSKNFPEFNLAVLKIKPKIAQEKFNFIPLGNDSFLRRNANSPMIKSAFALGKAVGQNFVTLTKPYNIINKFNLIAYPIEKVSYEIIEGAGYIVLENNVIGSAVYPENGGGPVIDKNGNLIAIIDYQKTKELMEIKEVAIPASVIKKALSFVMPTSNNINRDSGLETQDVTSYPEKFNPASLGLSSAKPQGAEIKTVSKDSPSDKAGLMPGDIILKFNGNIVNNSKTFTNMEQRSRMDGEIVLTVLRENKLIEFEVSM